MSIYVTVNQLIINIFFFKYFGFIHGLFIMLLSHLLIYLFFAVLHNFCFILLKY